MTDALSQADLLDLLRRNMPRGWVEGVLAGDGAEILHAYAAMFERLSLAVSRFAKNGYAFSADSFELATIELAFSRPEPAVAEPFTLLRGSVYATPWGFSFATAEDLFFDDFETGPLTVTARAILPRYDWDLPEPTTAANGALIDYNVTEAVRVRTNPPFSGTSLTFVQVSGTVGGKNGALDLHAEDRGLPRLAGESDVQLRSRLRASLEGMTPTAIRRYLDSIFEPLGASYTVIETFEVDFTTCWDGPSGDAGPYRNNVLAYDDPRQVGSLPAPPGNGIFWGRWLDERTRASAFIIVVPKLPAIAETGLFCDDTAMSLSEHRTTIGQRGYNFLDLDDTLSEDALPTGCDGRDEKKAAVYRAVAAGVRRIKAFGVVATIVLEGQ